MRRLTNAAVLVLFVLFPGFALAEIPTVTVSDSCVVTDTEGNSHEFSGRFLGICALSAAKEQGVVSDYALQNFSFGLFLQSLNGITPGATEFWSISQNGAEAMVGLSDLSLGEADTLSFQLTDWSTNTAVGSPIAFRIALLASAPQASKSSSGGGGEFLQDRVFNLESAFDFLVAKQHADGSFSSPMLTDWAAIAFGTATDEVCNDACPAAREKLRAYVARMATSTSTPTDLERHIMALEALAIDPYTAPGSPVDELVAKFDGTQMGNSSLVNDDIFAIFPLINAGYTKNDATLEAIFSFIISKQKTNGSWEESVDLTAAAIQVLSLFPERGETEEALARAKDYIRRNQDESGIFGKSSFSLSWVLQAIAALGESPEDWKKSGVTPLGYLGVLQQDDGGVEPMTVSEETRVWATSYAIPAAFGEPWSEILHDFSRPVPIEPQMPIASTSSPVSAPEKPAVVIHAAAALEPAPVPEEIVQSTTTEATTTTLHSLTAAAADASSDSAKWAWLLGLFIILGAAFYFVRRA